MLTDPREMVAAGISSNLRIENPKDLEIEQGRRIKGIQKKANYYETRAETQPSPIGESRKIPVKMPLKIEE